MCIALVISCFFSLHAVNLAAPARLPNTLPGMNTPGFWINLHPNPDSLVIANQQIAEFNERVHKQGTVTRIVQHAKTYSGSAIRKEIRESLRKLKSVAKYDSSGFGISEALWDSLLQNANVEEVPPSVQVRFGFPAKLTNQRLAPSELNLNSDSLDVEFDQLQNSGYDMGTPTVFYHDSADGLWVYGACSTSSGWYRKSDVCFLYRTDWLNYIRAESKVVVTKAKADIWRDAEARNLLTFCRIGTAFPLLGESGAYYQIQIPKMDGFSIAYLAKEDAHKGYLPYTARNVYKLAFVTLGTGYGWGDSYGDFDCSSLLKHVFSCFGIFLPRNGLQQAKAAALLYEFSPGDSTAFRDSVIVNLALPAITFLRLSGHIMLYLGAYNGKPYVLHDIWGYRCPDGTGKDDILVVNKTVVSDLSLGEGSKRNTLLQRLTTVSAVR